MLLVPGRTLSIANISKTDKSILRYHSASNRRRSYFKFREAHAKSPKSQTLLVSWKRTNEGGADPST